MMFKIEKNTENIILLSEYSNPVDFQGEINEDGKTYLLFSNLSEKLLKESRQSTKQWFSIDSSQVLST